VELSNTRKDGGALHVALLVVPVMDASAKAVTRFVGVQFDVTKQRAGKGAEPPGTPSRAEAAWVSAGRPPLEEVLVAFALADAASGAVKALSPGMEALTGFSAAELVGAPWSFWVGAGTRWEAVRALERSPGEGEGASERALAFKRDGSPVWLAVLALPLWDSYEGGPATVLRHLHVHVDVTSSRTRRVGRYQLGRKLGAGSSGTVMVAKNVQTGERVAVKVVDAKNFRSIDDTERITEEVRILESLEHPHIVSLREFMYLGGCFYFVMELAGAGNLHRAIFNSPARRLTEDRARNFFHQVLSALDYCHRRRVVHRDLKPENLLLDDAGDIKVADFGLSTVVSPFASSNSLSSVCGTPEFNAPEVFRAREAGDSGYGPSVDVWSLGVILYEMVTGNLPFRATGKRPLEQVIRAGKFSVPAHVSPEARDLLRAMLIVDPRERATLAEVQRHPWLGGEADDDLRDLSDEGEDACTEEPPSRAEGLAHRVPWPASRRSDSEAHPGRLPSILGSSPLSGSCSPQQLGGGSSSPVFGGGTSPCGGGSPRSTARLPDIRRASQARGRAEIPSL